MLLFCRVSLAGRDVESFLEDSVLDDDVEISGLDLTKLAA
jgi:hypothetical protein